MTNCCEYKTNKMLNNYLNASPSAKLEFNKKELLLMRLVAAALALNKIHT